jgi:hypothetical protein
VLRVFEAMVREDDTAAYVGVLSTYSRAELSWAPTDAPLCARLSTRTCYRRRRTGWG